MHKDSLAAGLYNRIHDRIARGLSLLRQQREMMRTRAMIFVLVLIAICSGSLLVLSENEIPELTPCTVSSEYLGQVVSVAGIIGFIDDSDPDAMYSDVEEFPCRIGIAFDRILAISWPGGAPNLEVGASIVAIGTLTRNVVPQRPELSHFVVEVTEKPIITSGEESSPGSESAEPRCTYTVEEMETVSAEGTVVFFDDSKAAGIFVELVTVDGCLTTIWVERDYWNQWLAEEQVRLTPGYPVRVIGLLTTVQGIATIDLADPPELLAQVTIPCEAFDEEIDKMLLVEGTVGFIDTSDPEGMYIEIGTQDCYIGVWIATEEIETWTAVQLDLLNLGTEVVATGYLRASQVQAALS